MTSIARQEENPPSTRQLPVEPQPEEGLLRKLGVGFQLPAQAEYGAAAYPSILRRLTSAISLLALVVFVGIAIAGLFGVFLLVGAFLLEQAISS